MSLCPKFYKFLLTVPRPSARLTVIMAAKLWLVWPRANIRLTVPDGLTAEAALRTIDRYDRTTVAPLRFIAASLQPCS